MVQKVRYAGLRCNEGKLFLPSILTMYKNEYIKKNAKVGDATIPCNITITLSTKVAKTVGHIFSSV
jgi:hypothetical protein